MALIGYEAEKSKIEGIIVDIQAQLGDGRPSATVQAAPKKRTLGVAARKRIAAAQRKRWAAIKKAKAQPEKSKRKLSAAGRKAIVEATRKRWAAVRKAAKAHKTAPKPKVRKAAPKVQKTATQETVIA
jgi:hypothetical protein